VSTSPVNPYDPNPFGDPQVAARTAYPAIRPGGLTAICVIAVVLGAMGFMSSGMKGVNLVFGKQLQAMFAGMGGMPNQKMADAQQEMNDAMWEVTDRFWIPNVVLACAQFALAIALLFGGLKALKLQARGRKVLLAALVCVVVFEFAQLGVNSLMQIQMMPIMETYMPRMMESAPGNNAGGEEMARTFAKFSLIAGLIMQGGWMLVKMVFLAVAIWYLNRQRIRSLFAGVASPGKGFATTNADQP
jgi:hypothetical protein